MKLHERIEFLRQNPIFWSCIDTSDNTAYIEAAGGKHFENFEKDLGRHAALWKKGIKIHSVTLSSGWIGDGEYDYSLTDKLLENLYKTIPDAYFLPRVFMDAPLAWCKNHPEDLLVYHNGPRTAKEIAELVGTPAHDWYGFNKKSVNGSRENIDGLIALESFSSPRWLKDASEALSRLIEHIGQFPWAEKILGYHIAYGCCGETTTWGSWETSLERKGDYGIVATREFEKYARLLGKNYKKVPEPEDRFVMKKNDLAHLFLQSEEDEPSVLYSKFISDANVNAMETFGKTIKACDPDLLTGVFFGYLIEVPYSSNAGHLGFDRVVNSEYIDFVAGPKGYYRVDPYGPGFGQAVPNSINLKKLWVDEIDNRTHLTDLSAFAYVDNSAAKDMSETRAVYWREFSKNIAFNQGYWWMDLMGGWLDAECIQNEIGALNEMSARLYKEIEAYRSVTEVLLVIDENAFHYMRPNGALHSTFFEKFGATIKECGAPIDLYRMSDLSELDLKRYKIIFFLNAFCTDNEKLKEILEKTRADCHFVFNYTAGILNVKNGGFGLENVRELTGFTMAEFPAETQIEGHENCPFPMVYIKETEKCEVLKRYPQGDIRAAKKIGGNGRTYIADAMPTDMTTEFARSLMQSAGVHFYAPEYCTVNADSRFVYMISGRGTDGEICLPAEKNCENVFTGEIYRNVKKIPVKLKAGNGVFIKYI